MSFNKSERLHYELMYVAIWLAMSYVFTALKQNIGSKLPLLRFNRFIRRIKLKQSYFDAINEQIKNNFLIFFCRRLFEIIFDRPQRYSAQPLNAGIHRRNVLQNISAYSGLVICSRELLKMFPPNPAKRCRFNSISALVFRSKRSRTQRHHARKRVGFIY